MERRFLVGLRSFLIAGTTNILMGTVGTIAAAEQSRQPILIPGIQEPEEMRVEPLPINKVEPPAPLRELAEATNNFSKKNLPEWLPVLDRILCEGRQRGRTPLPSCCRSGQCVRASEPRLHVRAGARRAYEGQQGSTASLPSCRSSRK